MIFLNINLGPEVFFKVLCVLKMIHSELWIANTGIGFAPSDNGLNDSLK